MPDTDFAPLTSHAPAAVHDTPTDQPPAGGAEAASTGGALARAGEMIHDAVSYGIVVTQLAIAAVRLAHLSEKVTGTYEYIESCADSVQRLADQAAGMNVDRDTVGEHRDAATVMLSVLDEARDMAQATEDLSTLFQQTADAHEADYGPVDDAIAAKEGELADREFYANR
ncbi:hypothetical protein ACFYUY_34950 [Kitasatospora sp. NPDC004745]|uniref:hypothetical protein n=1 Tax=Kitasatospora sp. NPDC004745 TaxID=3364019 RepID=UPI0036CCE19F